MRLRTVFISSVILGFEAARDAPKAAVESLDLRPIMAEQFPAYSTTSRTACLDEVRASDIYVGILGARYGYVSGSGVSPTEEEFDEARKQGKHILVFVMPGDREPKQQAFLKRISSYEQGLQLKFLEDSAQLGPQITRALLRLIGDRPDARLDVTGAQIILAKRLTGLPRTGGDPGIAAALVPARQTDPYLRLVDFQGGKLGDMLLQAALFGETAIFSPQYGTECSEAGDHTEFSQTGAQRRLRSVLRFYEDGSLTWWSVLRNEDGGSGGVSLVRMHVIDEESVAKLVTAFLRYGEAFYAALPDAELISSLYFWSALLGVGCKRFGRLVPLPAGEGMSLGMGKTEDPFYVSPSPSEVPRAHLQDAAAMGEETRALYARRFKVAGAYYPPA